jgi:drug/metabolite transporter (DMT)-like permease
MQQVQENRLIGREKTKTQTTTFIWLMVMVLLWGLSWPATKLALSTIPPLWLATIRFGSAGICLFIFVASRGELRFPGRKDWPIIASVGFLQMMTFTGLGMIAMQYTDTSHAVLLAYTTPLWGVIASWMLLRKVPTPIQLAALVIGMSGIVLICSPLEMNWRHPGVIMGCAFLLIGAIAWSLVILHIKHHPWQATPLSLAPWQMLLATIPLALCAYWLEGAPGTIALNQHLLSLLFFIGPVATSACFVISAEHGRRISVFAMSNFTLGVPMIGALSSSFWLGNHLSPLFLCGLALIFAGVLLTAFSANRAAKKLCQNQI